MTQKMPFGVVMVMILMDIAYGFVLYFCLMYKDTLLSLSMPFCSFKLQHYLFAQVELAHGGRGHSSSIDRHSSHNSGRGPRGGVSRRSDYRGM